jgi:hypothetical protein
MDQKALANAAKNGFAMYGSLDKHMIQRLGDRPYMKQQWLWVRKVGPSIAS